MFCWVDRGVGNNFAWLESNLGCSRDKPELYHLSYHVFPPPHLLHHQILSQTHTPSNDPPTRPPPPLAPPWLQLPLLLLPPPPPPPLPPTLFLLLFSTPLTDIDIDAPSIFFLPLLSFFFPSHIVSSALILSPRRLRGRSLAFWGGEGGIRERYHRSLPCPIPSPYLLLTFSLPFDISV